MASKVVDISSWSLKQGDKTEPLRMEGVTNTGPVHVTGYWDDTQYRCMACRVGIRDVTAQTAVAYTEDEPPECLGVLCVACTESFMKNGSITFPKP